MRQRLSKLVYVLVLVALCFCAAPAAQAAGVRVIPATISAASGDVVSLAVQVDSATDLAGFQFDFSCPPAALQIKSVTIAPVFGYTVKNSFDAAAGNGIVAAYGVAPQSGTNVTLATIELTVINGGTLPVTITRQLLGSTSGDEILSTATGGSITATYPLTVTLDFAPGIGGTLSGTTSQTINFGGSATPVTALPNPGYLFINWTGTGGFVPVTINPISVNPATATQTITANFGLIVNGTCGSSHNAVLTAAPSANLCSSGTAGSVTGSGPWDWNCSGINGGTSITCSASIQTNTVTFQSGGNGSITGAASQSVVYGGSTTAVTAVAAPGYHFVNWSGTGGFVTSTTNPLAITNVIAAHIISATFAADPVNGTCGASNGMTFKDVPTVNLCGIGSASSVIGSGPWSWSCSGTNGGTSMNCSAFIDSTGPALTVSTLASGSITNNATLTISGTVSDTGGVAGLTVNTSAVIITNGSFSYPITLVNGSNTITTVATDTVGNTTTDIRTITLDKTTPVLTVTSPADTSNTAQAATNVTGTINETSTVTISLNGGVPQAGSITGTTYTASVNLAVGLNTITITAKDLAGNQTSVVRTVTYDNNNPSLAITSPNQDITTALNNITISGTVSDTITATTVAISFNSQNFTPVISNGVFSQNLTIPAEGTYAITATATDAAGNSSSATRNIIYAIPINGICGSSHNAVLTAAPSANLCVSGTAGSVTDSGPWSWSCSGTNGGSTASCSASLQALVDTVAPTVSFTVPATSPTLTVVIGSLTAKDNVTVAGYLLTESSTPPLVTDAGWQTAAPTEFKSKTWGNHTIFIFAKDSAGNISAPVSKRVYVGTNSDVDGVFAADGTGTVRYEPTIIDALRSLKLAIKAIKATDDDYLHGNVAPLENGIPNPDTELNLGDTIVILRRAIGL